MTRRIDTPQTKFQQILQEGVSINARKFDNSIHRYWTADLVGKQGSLLTFIGEFDREITHPQLGVIKRGTVSHEYYWLDRWYNVFRFYEPDGEFRNYYCNINLPPTYKNNSLDYVDLDIDVLVQKDFTYKILDQEEFEEHALLYNYPREIKQRVKSSLADILKMIEKRIFPFDQ